MIQRLYIRDFAVVDEIDLSFGDALNLLTGETGSGKSIIVDAIGVALGERADSDVVRSGRERAVVEVVLDISASPDATRILNDAGFEAEDGCIIVSREIQKTGKSQCRINGRSSTVSLLKSVTDHLVDTHGQHEHQFLLDPTGILRCWMPGAAKGTNVHVRPPNLSALSPTSASAWLRVIPNGRS